MRSLYANRRTIAAGVVVHIMTALAIYAKVGDPFYLFAALAFFIVGSGRLVLMRSFDRVELDGAPRATIWNWERRSIYGTAAVSLVLGLQSAYSVSVTEDAFAEIASISITMASMISVVGRNYGSKLTVDIMSTLQFAPLGIGFFMAGDPFKAILAFFLVPLVLTTRSMANGVRSFLYQTVLGKREISIMAERFDTALNNMSHGLVMLDNERRIIVANRNAARLLNLGSSDDVRDRTLGSLLRLAVKKRALDRTLSEQIVNTIEELCAGRRSRALVKVSDELHLEFSARRRRDNSGVVLIFENVTARIKADEKINYLARFDSLTGMPNRYHFADLVRNEMSVMDGAEMVALVVLDVDDFKHVNDTLGHVAGDRLLCELSARLKAVDPERIIASRFGGDEFVLLVRDVDTSEDVSAVMGRVFDALCGVYSVQGNRLFASVSAGLVLSRRSGFVLDELQIKADLALHESKKRDKNTWTVFADSMDEKYRMRQLLKKDLREAIERRALSLVYQPMFSADGLRIARCEALSRWEHKTHGPVSPGEYIPLAEEMGIVPLITEFMLEVACKDCASWPGGLGVSVNLSALDLRNRDIIKLVTNALDQSGLDPRRLEVEVTESAFVEDAVTARNVLNELRAIGLTIAIDDFGTGYSNLSYLNSLPVTKVKVDRSFVRDVTNSAKNFKLLSGIVHLAREMDLSVTIEGVETEEQLRMVCATGHVDLIQGFIFGKPLPQNSIADLAAKSFISGENQPQVHRASAAQSGARRNP
ncbi:putative bifunctional diguanylate cyclase/phosphodiesterase [Pararhizobium haloflavum]|uniref:putative bifunctional diguanylate cyclase/phosphodiesterase n=1 Tax=Pararhizobium haloflavum TaxID=2037914 RepID=UPI001FE19A9C|nr:EAL domain-containing protein [Pararhizobium haloflavum]